MLVAQALLFDRDAVDIVDDWERLVDRLGRSSILWIDTSTPGDDEAGGLATRLGLSDASRARLSSPDREPYFADFGSYAHITVSAPRSDHPQAELIDVECLVSKRWVVTVHDDPVAVFDEFRERASGSGDVGRLDGLEFLADLLEWVLAGYLAAFERIEAALGEFDTRAMEGRLERTDAELRRLVELRRRVGILRRALVSHRGVFLALTKPELGGLTSRSSAERFGELRDRLEEAVQSARDSRQSVVGSFEVLITLTEHQTNEIVKVLTLASVLLLPGALIAGVMGMNFRIGLFENPDYFWLVLVAIAGIAMLTLAAAKARSWI
jgi:magnesium transporter